MRITIRVTTITGESHTFQSTIKCLKFLKENKASAYFMNNEQCRFRSILELRQLELAERRHNRRQGL